MGSFSKNSIENLKHIAKLPNLTPANKQTYFNAIIDILEYDQDEFEKWILLFIQNHTSWLVHSEYDDNLINCFESEFEECLDKLDEFRFKNIIKTIKVGDDLDSNITEEILLLEAARFGFIPPTEKITKRNSYPIRKINSDIQDVYEIHFPCSYQRVADKYKRMRYCNCGDQPVEESHLFGGTIDSLQPLGINRILTIDPIPLELKIKSVKKLTIGFNFDKAFWIPINIGKPYFIQHDQQGEPVKELTSISKNEIEFYKESPLNECQIVLSKIPKKYVHHWKSKNEWRIGGEPAWIQHQEEVTCPSCKEHMEFLIQLPSGDLKDINNETVFYGSDGGTTYGFWCDSDRIMGYIWQDS